MRRIETQSGIDAKRPFVLALLSVLLLGGCAASAFATEGSDDNIITPSPTTVLVETGCPPVPGSTYPEGTQLDDSCNPVVATTTTVLVETGCPPVPGSIPLDDACNPVTITTLPPATLPASL